jgi:streptogramin lyase
MVVLKNGTYDQIGTISKGLVEPNGDSVDSAGNVYVADYGIGAVREYRPHNQTPSFTYKAGMIDPVDVTVDANGNVYEADYNGWAVNEYAQGSDTVVQSCSVLGYVESIAVDSSGDVFVDYNQNATGSGSIQEFKGGLAGCHATGLPIALEYAGGIAVDKHGKLLVVDQGAETVDIIAPPYTKAKAFGSGYTDPFHITLNKSNKLAFITDLYDVVVMRYPSGTLDTMIGGTGHGFELPAGAADNPNAVY